MIDATCSNGKVTADGVEVEGALILSKGQGQSEGALFIEGSKPKYITSNASDIEDLLGKLTESLDKLTNILTAIGAGMTGPTTAPPPTLATDLAEITAISQELNALKGNLK